MSDSSSTAPLTKDLVTDPGMWRLSMLIAGDGIDIALVSMVEDNSLIYRHIPLPDDETVRLRAFEDTIYGNPLLLADFGKTDILVRTRRFSVLPVEISDTGVRRRILQEFWPDLDSFSIFTDSELVLPGDRDSISFAIPAPLASFLRRTFPSARISHALTPMVRYFAHCSRLGRSGKMYVCLRKDEIDMIAFTVGGLRMAVTTSVSDIGDALYYIMAALHTCRFSPSDVEIMLCGDNSMREAITPVLRRFVGYVMPVIFPSAMFRAGKDAMAAPFNLILIPLCE